MVSGSKSNKKETRVRKPKTKNEEQSCYVLIKCGQPSADGKLSVEMTYEGDPFLASYLLESAQGFIQVGDEEGSSYPAKSL